MRALRDYLAWLWSDDLVAGIILALAYMAAVVSLILILQAV